MTNISLSKYLIQKLYDKGVRSFVICSGGRNAAFIEAFSHLEIPEDVDIHWGFEERGASFFALGRAKASGSGAAVFTTSGTALLETHAALVEAYYAGHALVVVSADRPLRLWGTGAPQTIVQKDVFGTELGPSISWQDAEALEKTIFPSHINCPMEEPLVDETLKDWHLKTYKRTSLPRVKVQADYGALENLDLNAVLEKYKDIRRPFFVLSGLSESESKEVEFLKSLKVPIYVESTAAFLNFPKRLSAEAFDLAFIKKNFDAIIRVGGIPTHKIWRQVEAERDLKVLNFSYKKFPGRSNDEIYSLRALESFVAALKISYKPEAFKHMTSRERKLKRHIKLKTKSEMAFFEKIKKAVNKNPKVKVFLGNSLPIRLWDLVFENSKNKVLANRGANGIDGLLSTAYGLAYKSKDPVVAVIGDLSALYDLMSPWYYSQNKKEFNIKIVIINNSGGQIFSSLFQNPKFTNPHKLNFSHFAKMWGLKYKKVNTTRSVTLDYKNWPDILEVVPDNEQTDLVWKKVKSLRS